MNDFNSELSKVLRYGAAVDPHPNYTRDGYSPDLHSLLTTIAGANEDQYPTSAENANVILGSGRTDLWPSLGAALKSEKHSLADALNWKNVEKGLALDHALQTTQVTHSGYGLNSKVAPFDSLPPSKQRSLLSGFGHVTGRDDHSEYAVLRLTQEMQRKVPDVKDNDIAKALQRAQQRADVLAEDSRRRSAHIGYQQEIERHQREPDLFHHPDETNYWRRMGFEGPPEPVPIDPTVLLRLKRNHARRY